MQRAFRRPPPVIRRVLDRIVEALLAGEVDAEIVKRIEAEAVFSNRTKFDSEAVAKLLAPVFEKFVVMPLAIMMSASVRGGMSPSDVMALYFELLGTPGAQVSSVFDVGPAVLEVFKLRIQGDRVGKDDVVRAVKAMIYAVLSVAERLGAGRVLEEE